MSFKKKKSSQRVWSMEVGGRDELDGLGVFFPETFWDGGLEELKVIEDSEIVPSSTLAELLRPFLLCHP